MSDESYADVDLHTEGLIRENADLERKLTLARNALEWANTELGKCTKPNPVTEALATTAP